MTARSCPARRCAEFSDDLSLALATTALRGVPSVARTESRKVDPDPRPASLCRPSHWDDDAQLRDPPERGVAHRRSDAEPEVVAFAVPDLRELGEASAHGHGQADRLQLVIRQGQRVVVTGRVRSISSGSPHLVSVFSGTAAVERGELADPL